MHAAAAEERAGSALRGALDAQVEQLRATHATQLAALRDELAGVLRHHQDLKESVLPLTAHFYIENLP